jgi:Putative Actinobacterial Holin-X, holin superfamily III
MDGLHDDRSLGKLFGDLSRQLGTLIRQEIDLAKTETMARATSFGRDAAMVGAGAALAYAALLVALVGVSLLFADLGMTPWLAFVLVAVIAGVIAAVLIQQGRARLQRTDLAPRETIETLKEDAAWAKERVK